MSDPAVPKAVREDIAQYGHCTDEYDADSDPPHWPHQLYVREAKRLVGDFVWSEWLPDAARRNRSIGLGSYNYCSDGSLVWFCSTSTRLTAPQAKEIMSFCCKNTY